MNFYSVCEYFPYVFCSFLIIVEKSDVIASVPFSSILWGWKSFYFHLEVFCFIWSFFDQIFFWMIILPLSALKAYCCSTFWIIVSFAVHSNMAIISLLCLESICWNTFGFSTVCSVIRRHPHISMERFSIQYPGTCQPTLGPSTSCKPFTLFIENSFR